MSQLTLDDLPKIGSHHSDAGESEYVAARKAAKKVARDYPRILEYLANQRDGAIQGEISRALGIPRWVLSGRIRELVKSGRVEYAGFMRVDPDTHAKQRVWRVGP